MKSAREVLADRSFVMLDFDGPVCAVFDGPGARAVATELSTFLGTVGVRIPPALAETSDPFALLRLASTVSPGAARRADTEFRKLEISAIATAPATDGVADVLRSLTDEGRTVAIVSNNSTPAVKAYMDGHELSPFISAIAGRSSPDVGLLKPSPHLLYEAMHAVSASPGNSVMIGDSASDIEAARAAGVAVIAFANKPAKRQHLAAFRPDAIIDHLMDLVAEHAQQR